MARIRTIKPEFFTSEDIVSRTPMARLLYIATWCEADKEGRLLWKPKTFKLRYFPGDSCDIEALCGELVDAGLVVLYGDGLAYIPAFSKHQHINPRESQSSLPDPHASTTRAPRVPNASRRDSDGASTVSDAQVGREGKEIKEDASRRVSRSAPSRPPEVSEQVWSDWLQLRKAKKAPVTETVLSSASAEASKAGITLEAFLRIWCARGSQGLEAGWLKASELSTASRAPGRTGPVDIFALNVQ